MTDQENLITLLNDIQQKKGSSPLSERVKDKTITALKDIRALVESGMTYEDARAAVMKKTFGAQAKELTELTERRRQLLDKATNIVELALNEHMEKVAAREQAAYEPIKKHMEYEERWIHVVENLIKLEKKKKKSMWFYVLMCCSMMVPVVWFSHIK